MMDEKTLAILEFAGMIKGDLKKIDELIPDDSRDKLQADKINVANIIHKEGIRELGEAAPVQAAPVQAAPVQAAPVQAAPVQAAPVQAAPVQTTPVQTTPVQTTPVQTTPGSFDKIEKSLQGIHKELRIISSHLAKLSQ
jgi:hypothetical protein